MRSDASASFEESSFSDGYFAYPELNSTPIYEPVGFSPAFTQTAKDFAASSQKIANEVIQLTSSSSSSSSSSASNGSIGRVHVHHHHHHSTPWYYSPWFSPQPTVVVVGDRGTSRSNEKDDNDRAFRFLVGLVATVVGGIAFYTIGKNVSHLSEAGDELSDIRTFKRELIEQGQTQSSSTLDKIIQLKQKIFNRIHGNAVWNIATTVTLAVGCTIAVVGALTASYGCMTAGTVVGLAAGAGMLVKWGMDSTDKKHARDANQLLKEINKLPEGIKPT